MSGEPTAPASRPAVRLHQTHDAAGTPAPVEFLQILPRAPIQTTVGASAMTFLEPLNVTRSDRPHTYFYDDPERGSGWLEIEGFRPGDADRVHQLVRMEEIVRVVGAEPRKNHDYALGNSVMLRANNPWIMIAVGGMLFFAGVYALIYIPVHPDLTVLYLVTAVVLMSLAIALWVLVGRARVGWWHRARRHVRESGERMPDDLRILN
jgi:hypothetical protein